MIKLKACPFCGKTDRFEWTTRKAYCEMVEENGVATIGFRCLNCSLDIYEHSDIADYDEKLERLFQKWNSRAACEEQDDD